MEPVFRALADPTRRELLDELFRSDGQTLAALTSRFAMATRARYQFGAQIESAWQPSSHYRISHTGAPGELTVIHDQLREGADEHLYGGWSMILSGLKTWLETGEELTTPGSLQHGGLR